MQSLWAIHFLFPGKLLTLSQYYNNAWNSGYAIIEILVYE